MSVNLVNVDLGLSENSQGVVALVTLGDDNSIVSITPFNFPVLAEDEEFCCDGGCSDVVPVPAEFVAFFRYWFVVRWIKVDKCHGCGHMRCDGSTDDCVPF